MSIKFHSHHAIFDRRTDTVRIPAVVDNKLLVCAVAHEAIRKVLVSGDGPADFLLETYRRFARAFHTLAIYKHRTHKVQPDGILYINADDIPALDPPWDYESPRLLN